MSTTYWQTNAQSLGTSYLSPNELPQMLYLEETFNSAPYLDSAQPPNASVGIGVNYTHRSRILKTS